MYFHVHNAPVTFGELTNFAGVVADHLDHDPEMEEVSLVLAADDPTQGVIAVLAGDEHSPATIQAHADQLLASPRRMAALASRIGWSPSDDEPTAVSWFVVAVASGQPAVALVRRIAEDEGWTRIPHTALPWIGASSAGALRAALEAREPLTIKMATDKRLFRRPDEEPSPPVDDQGRL
jgi:Asp/Glu/hydantoin racemase